MEIGQLVNERHTNSLPVRDASKLTTFVKGPRGAMDTGSAGDAQAPA